MTATRPTPTPAPAPAPDDGGGSALRRAYLRTIEVLPDSFEPHLRTAATRTRVARSGVRQAWRSAHHFVRYQPRVRPIYQQAVAAMWWMRTRFTGVVPTVCIDARGIPNAEVVALVARAGLDRPVVLVDDPALEPLRRARLRYEYLPTLGVAGMDAAEQQRLLDGRWDSLQHVYRIRDLVHVDDLDLDTADR